MGVSSGPDWLVTEPSAADAIAMWAASRGLAFERRASRPPGEQSAI